MSDSKQFCTFWMGDRLYGMPVGEVQEVMREQVLTRVPLAAKRVRGLINLRGKIVTAIDLRESLDLPDRQSGTALMNVVVTNEENTVSFLVDSIGDVLDVGQETFEKVPDTLQGESRKFVTGVYKLRDGLLHVLDAAKCADLSEAPKNKEDLRKS